MLMDVLRAIINSPFKENFNGKRKKTINILIFFFSFLIKLVSKFS